MNYEQYYKARNLLEQLLEKDLLGPVQENEIIIDTWPSDYYLTGRLFPQGMLIRQEELEKTELDDDVSDNEQPVNLCYSHYPSSIAISFTVRPGMGKLLTECKFAWYEPVEKKDVLTRTGKPKTEWHRRAKTTVSELDVSQSHQIFYLHHGLELHSYLQKQFKDGARTFTVAMINTNTSSKNLFADNQKMFFQPGILIKGTEDTREVFVEKKMRVSLNQDPEIKNLEMIYRHNKTFATGHGCSAGWQVQGQYASEVYTDFIARYELLQMKPALRVDSKLLSFYFLSSASKTDMCLSLRQMVDSYRMWIKTTEDKIEELPAEYHDVAVDNIKKCRETLNRIETGIKKLEIDSTAFKAFQLANQAMLLSRMQQEVGSDRNNHAWYPFQLAFILQEIPSVTEIDDAYRDIVDLLWFPTGGGKTEAYLGLSSYTIFLRRMHAVREKRPGGGVTIIMRYTLRLLTLQQFERASSLVCACELIRRDNEKVLGKEEIATGLWVGGGLTPNQRNKASETLKKICDRGFDALDEDEANPCQIQNCPWCKSTIRPAHYQISEEKMVIKCPNENCQFHYGLPVYIIDEDIYDYKPALIVATVDKFARMTWEKNVGYLFGLKTNLKPPELIIQDELHLISGPLGTITGLYEIAVDEFCHQQGIRPKIIASTATIRKARDQILSLYGRDFRQFPPQGTDIRDSYFAEESTAADKPSRLYKGILAPGASGNTLMIRVYSILLLATRYMKENSYDQEVIDSFWTLTGYFNSLKQLGGAVINVIDDVRGRLKYLFGTKFASFFSVTEAPEFLEFAELTSRMANTEIGKTLKRLEVKFPQRDVLDLILASNMLSVGIDIGRLGLMVLQGQPKSNSEYIQATSRVGRKTPGLVITMYDASRSRDRSHYEQFLAYHSSLYKYVEATSLTPFAERARDRALHTVLISLCRHLIDGLLYNDDAGKIADYHVQAEEQIEKILDKVQRIDPLELDDTRHFLFKVLEYWEELAQDPTLPYERRKNMINCPLLTHRFDDNSGALPALNSMRNVDVETKVLLGG